MHAPVFSIAASLRPMRAKNMTGLDFFATNRTGTHFATSASNVLDDYRNGWEIKVIGRKPMN
jgi:hypothetical protein